MNTATLKAPRALNPRTADVKYTGTEPEWRMQPTTENRISRLGQAFYWYGYHYGKKEVKEFMIDWLARNQRQREAKEFARVPDAVLTNVYGWLARMNVMGLDLLESEQLQLDNNIRTLLDAHRAIKEVVRSAEDAVTRPNIQDRLREKMMEAGAELEAMYDDMILAGGKMSADFKPMAVIRGMNVAPQMVGEIAATWRQRLAELEEVMAGKDAQLAEGYGQFGKLQIRNMVKFAEQVVADCGSYVQIKKTERAPRKKKPVSAEKLASKFKYLRAFDELKLTSESPTKLVGASEAWLYNVKTRKLVHVMADQHIGTFTVKGSSIIGFDVANSIQKTLRRPAEQIKALLAGGKPAARKLFKEIKATEVQFNGRGNENLMILKTY